MRSRSRRSVATLAAAYRRVWYIHWSTRRIGRSNVPQVGDGVFREHRQAEAGQQFGNGVVDLGVVVVGASGQHDAVRAGGLHPGERFRAGSAHIALEGLVLFPCGLNCGVHLGLRGSRHARAHEFGMRFHQLHVQAFLQVLLLVVRQPRVQERHARRAQLVDVQAQRFGVAGHDGAVEVVARPFVLLALPLAAREPDEVRVLFQQVHDVAVGQLGRVAHAFDWAWTRCPPRRSSSWTGRTAPHGSPAS